MGRATNEAVCLHISGPPGVGKSTLRTKLRNEFRRIPNGRTSEMLGSRVIADSVPLLQIEMPPNPTVRAVCHAIIEAYGGEIGLRVDEWRLTSLVLRFIEACGTGSILVDEAQRAVDRSGVVAGEHLLEWFKQLHGRAGVSLIFLGLGRLRYLFDQDSQLARRWNAEIRFQPYLWRDEQGQENIEEQNRFISILAVYRDTFPFPFSFDVEDEVTALRFYYASQGVFGGLKKLFREVLRVVSRAPQNRPTVSMEALAEAFESAVRRHRQNLENPFLGSFSLKLPPKVEDDGMMRPPAEERRRNKPRKQRNRDVINAFSKR